MSPIVKEKPSLEDEVKACFLIPKGARVVVIEDEFHYSGKLVIPEVAKRRPTTGTVLKVGPDVVFESIVDDLKVVKTPVKVGERVVFGSFSGTLIQFKGRPAYRILGVDEVLAEVTVDDSELQDVYI